MRTELANSVDALRKAVQSETTTVRRDMTASMQSLAAASQERLER